MKAISLWQPWATLVAIEAKRVETRSWCAPPAMLGQRIAIYATKGRARHDDDHPTRPGKPWTIAEEAEFLEREPFHRHLVGQALTDLTTGAALSAALPRGKVIATAVLSRCAPMTLDGIDRLHREQPDEYAFGLYDLDRFAWVLRDVIRTEPIDVTGYVSQGIFEVPDEMMAAGMKLDVAPGRVA